MFDLVSDSQEHFRDSFKITIYLVIHEETHIKMSLVTPLPYALAIYLFMVTFYVPEEKKKKHF